MCSDTLKAQKSIAVEDEMKPTSHKNSETRELTDKELSKMTSAMGDNVRSQSLKVSNIIQEHLKAEFAARRKNAPDLPKSRKSVAS